MDTLKFLKQKTQEKTQQDLHSLVKNVLGNHSTPDLGPNNRQKLKEEISLAKNLTSIMMGLNDPEKEKLRNKEEIVQNSDVAGILNGSPQTFELYEDFLRLPKNAPILEKNNTIECGAYLLMKNNQDSFKKDQLQGQTELHVSTLQPVMKSLQPIALSTSQIAI